MKSYLGYTPFRKLSKDDVLEIAKTDRKLAEQISKFRRWKLDLSFGKYKEEPDLEMLIEKFDVPDLFPKPWLNDEYSEGR